MKLLRNISRGPLSPGNGQWRNFSEENPHFSNEWVPPFGNGQQHQRPPFWNERGGNFSEFGNWRDGNGSRLEQGSCRQFDNLHDLEIFTAIKYALLLPLSILLAAIDLYIIFAICRNRNLRSISNYFLANLLASELVYKLLMCFNNELRVSPDGCVQCENSYLYVFALTSMHLIYFLSGICVAVDKYIKITRPLRYAAMVTRRVCIVVVTIAWVSALAGGGLASLLFQYLVGCTTPRALQSHLRTTMLFLSDGVVLPLVMIIMGLNMKIICIARHQARAIANMAPQHHGNSDNRNDDSDQQQQAVRKSTRYFKAFLWSFVLVWVPSVMVANISYILPIARENLSWSIGIRYGMNVLGLCQMLYGTAVLTMKQEQFRELWRGHWQTIKQKLHI
ncbi:trace amine-associated receptor 9-like [Patiria miniata]|uniref:G-protein coupled receptors family 1 profile domain-containing protein n=1 Tax=Patiria miniata TaxID=46514 RepID=A0A914B2R7_PATMI|nr:trace amine-associated receptor 9-like [Patiria miniata]